MQVVNCLRERPNTARVLHQNGSVLFETGYSGPPIEGDPRPADHPEVTEPYIAYSRNGSVEVSSVRSLYVADLFIAERRIENNIECECPRWHLRKLNFTFAEQVTFPSFEASHSVI
jgi:hypothetical protein